MNKRIKKRLGTGIFKFRVFIFGQLCLLSFKSKQKRDEYKKIFEENR